MMGYVCARLLLSHGVGSTESCFRAWASWFDGGFVDSPRKRTGLDCRKIEINGDCSLGQQQPSHSLSHSPAHLPLVVRSREGTFHLPEIRARDAVARLPLENPLHLHALLPGLFQLRPADPIAKPSPNGGTTALHAFFPIFPSRRSPK